MEPVGDIQAQATRLIQLLGDQQLQDRMAGAARLTAFARFRTELIIPQYESYYREICAQAGTAIAASVST